MTLRNLIDYGRRHPSQPGYVFYYHIPFNTPYIMVVASIHIGPSLQEGDWAAYIDRCPGENHDNEWLEIARYGGKVTEEDAKKWFPFIEELGYRQ